MILSSLITPFRIYNEFYDQARFTKDCNTYCEYELITDKTRLLPLQFQRPKSPYPIMRSWLRKDCVDFYSGLVTENQSNFYDLTPWIFNNNVSAQPGHRAVYKQGVSSVEYYNALTLGQQYTVKVIVSEKDITAGQTITLKIRNSMGPIADISIVGTHIVTFTATDPQLKIEANISGTNDEVTISCFSIYQINAFNALNGDYTIDPTIFEIKNIGDNDIVSHCGSRLLFPSTLPCGKYYLIMKSKDITGVDVYFFSEVISIKNFVPSQSPYIMFEWSNDCDLQDVKYTGLDCNYLNRLYIDGPIAKPEYPFTEEGVEDGEKKFNVTFQKWEKELNIMIPKSPEFIVDAATAMKLHNSIKYFAPIKNDQPAILTNEYFEVENFKYDLNYVLFDCATNVNLKVLFKKNFVDTSCCTPIAIVDQTCVPCDKTVADYTYPSSAACDGSSYFAFVGGSLYQYVCAGDIGSWELVVLTRPGYVVCVTSDNSHWYWNGSAFVKVAYIATLVDNANTSFTITGFSFPSTAVQIEVTYNGVTYTLPDLYSDADLAAGITINYADIPITLVDCLALVVRCRGFNAFCDYGFGETQSIIPKSGPGC